MAVTDRTSCIGIISYARYFVLGKITVDSFIKLDHDLLKITKILRKIRPLFKFKMACLRLACKMITTQIFFDWCRSRDPKEAQLSLYCGLGLLVEELEPLKDLKAEKGCFFGQN